MARVAIQARAKRPYDADRFFRFRKYWDYSGGIATDLFYHVVAPLNVCWDEPQFPVKVMATGGIYEFKDEREVPDTFHLLAEYAKGHSLVLSSSMANSRHIPGLIRGHEGTIEMVSHGQFEGMVPYITVTPEVRQGKAIGGEKYAEKFGPSRSRSRSTRRTRCRLTWRTSCDACAPARSRTWTSRPAPAPWSSSTWPWSRTAPARRCIGTRSMEVVDKP